MNTGMHADIVHTSRSRSVHIMHADIVPSLRMYQHGNASFYATWIDEGLNVVLRCQAQRAHALTFDRTVLAAFALIKQLRLNRFLSGTQDDSEQEEA